MNLRNKFLVKSIVLIFLAVAMFTLSSKGKDDKDPDWSDDGVCADIALADLKINFAFSPDIQSIPGRNSPYENYVPPNDIRNGFLQPALDLTDGTTYYGVVSVTSPQCTDFRWTGRIERRNGANGVMNIKVPDANVETRIKIEYYEACSNGVWAESNTRVKYVRDKTFMTSPVGSPSETFFLVPSGTLTCFSKAPFGPRPNDLLTQFDGSIQ